MTCHFGKRPTLGLFRLLAILAAVGSGGAFASPGGAAAPGPPRQVRAFDLGWRFHLGDATGADRPDRPAFDDSAWQPVNLPHDWSIEGPVGKDPATMDGPFDRASPAGANGGYLNGGVGWYRKTFPLPAAARRRRWSLLCDGAYMDSDVWLNGHLLGNHPYGYTSFSYDLTPFLSFGGPNVVAVRLNAQQPASRWYSGAGLYRHVRLIATQPVHIAQWGTYVTTPQATPTGALVRVRTQVNNDGSQAAEAMLTTTILDPSGKTVARRATRQSLVPAGHAAFDQTLPLHHARLWSPDSPALYRAVSEVRVGPTLTDSTTTPFGIRTIAFTKDRGFFLNGVHIPIKGVCDHHDLGCLGAAALRRGFERQLQVLKGMGCNAIRMSHNPPSPELLDLCDQMGFLVMDESFDEWEESHNTYGYGRFFGQWSEPDMVSMLDRDRNHPSIILWSIGNEILEGREGTPTAGPLARRLAAICHREDPTRPVTSAGANASNAWKSGLGPALDVFGVNYDEPFYFDRNKPGGDHSVSTDPTGFHGELPMIGSETSSQVDSRGEYGLRLDAQGAVQVAPRLQNQVSCYDLTRPPWASSGETDLLALKNAPWVAGEFVWTGFDYIGEPTPFRWPSRSSYFGLLDLCGFPKDRYYLYKSQWSDAPLVHILPSSWTWPGFEGKPVPVRVFTNADTVELFLNGRSLGVQTFATDAKQLHLEWSVPYAPGVLKAVARKNGQIVAADAVRTAGAPARIALAPDRSQITGDGQDLSFITVTVLDKDGTVCPDAANELHFSLQGGAARIAGLDDGDATNHEPFQGTQHRAYHGLALVVLRSRPGASGPVTLTASADGLPAVHTTVTVNRFYDREALNP